MSRECFGFSPILPARIGSQKVDREAPLNMKRRSENMGVQLGRLALDQSDSDVGAVQGALLFLRLQGTTPQLLNLFFG